MKKDENVLYYTPRVLPQFLTDEKNHEVIEHILMVSQ
jgi:hypothetical protein